ncbi:MAG: hypothetical protein IJL75_00755 [Eubacterium sp.]|nr:hypothetical protein [Eubacterium sp.]
MNRTLKRTTVGLMVLTLTMGTFSVAGVNVASNTDVAMAKSNEVSLKKKSCKLTIKQNGAQITKDSAKIALKKKKGVKIKKITYLNSDNSIAKVNKKGKVTPKSKGASDVTVSVKYRYKKKTKTKDLIYKINVDQSYRHILSGLTLKHKTYATYVDGVEGICPCYDTSVEVGERFFAWDCLSMSIEDASIAGIGEDGFIIGKKEGTTTVTIKSTDDTNLSVTATLKVFPTMKELEVKNDLYNSVRADYLAAVESGWTEEEKNRYIDENGAVHWSLFSVADFQKETNSKKIIETYKTIGKQPDNTAQDALNSVLTTGNAMLDGGPEVEDEFLRIVNEKIVEPIKAAKTIDELIAVSEDFEKRGLVGFIKAKGFFLHSDIRNYMKDVINRVVASPEAPVDPKMRYCPTISGPYNMAGHSFSNKKEINDTKKEILGSLSMVGFGEPTEKQLDDYVAFLDEFSTEFYNPKYETFVESLGELDKDFPNLRIAEHFKTKGYNTPDDEMVTVENPGAYIVLNKYLAKETNLDILKMYLTESSTFYFTEFTRATLRNSYAVHPELMEMSGAASVEEAIEENYRKAMSTLQALIPFDFDHIYTDTVYPKNYKEKFEELVQGYKDIYREAITGSEYGATFKSNMLKKLDKMRVDCLYPDAADYKKYEIPYDLVTAAEGGNLADNLLKIRQYQADMECITVGSYMKDLQWRAPSTAVFQGLPDEKNAFYNRYGNYCFFCHGLIGLNVMFSYDETGNADIDVRNIAYMGTLVGHEMGHAFDNSGSSFNEDGMLFNRWGNDDPSPYEKKVDKLAALYGSMVMYADRDEQKAYYQEGYNVVSEAMADLGGTEIALRLLEKKYPGRDDLVKQFYRYTAEQWVTTEQDKLVPQRLYTYLGDVHPLSRSRANGVASMMDEYYRVFDISETDAMYVAPEDRVSLWG